MIITLPATTTDEIVSVLLTQEGAAGSSRVLTLVIDTCAADLEEALTAAHGASHALSRNSAVTTAMPMPSIR